MASLKNIKIVSSENMMDIEKYNLQLQTLILSTEGLIPGSRGFGLSREFLSRPQNEAANLFAIELEEKVEEYIPDITIASVEATPGELGETQFTIHIEWRN